MSRRRPRPVLAFTFVAAAVSVVATLLLTHRWGLAPLWAYLAGVNIATTGAYVYDKAVVGGRSSRVPERVLHLLAAVGGSPSALLAQRLLRHKTIKQPFQIHFWLIVLAQSALLVGWLWYRWRRVA